LIQNGRINKTLFDNVSLNGYEYLRFKSCVYNSVSLFATIMNKNLADM